LSQNQKKSLGSCRQKVSGKKRKKGKHSLTKEEKNAKFSKPNSIKRCSISREKTKKKNVVFSLSCGPHEHDFKIKRPKTGRPAV